MSRNHFPLLLAAALLAGCATPPAAPLSAYVVLGADGAAQARVLTTAAVCPAIEIDGASSPMQLRAGAATLPLRATQSAPEDSKPSAFPLLTCEAALPAGSRGARVQGQALAVPKAQLQRIVVIGDTGCRLKRKDNEFQHCDVPAEYPFAIVAAAAAAWKPDLVVHVGDFHYRENACPPGNAGCANSPWGYGWDAWQADFFRPAQALLAAAPWVMARGNHESCGRGGQGFWRFLDPRPLLPGRDCNAAADDGVGDYSDPYAVSLGSDAQLLVFDTSNTSWRGLKPDDPRMAHYADTYRKLDALSLRAGHNIGVAHHPLLGFAAQGGADGKVKLLNGDQGLIDAFGALNPGLLPARMDAVLSGHVHLWEQLSFASAHPSQFISGFSGTAEDLVPLPATLPPGASPAPGAHVDQFSSWIDGFGFMTMERRAIDAWDISVWDLNGKLRNTCQLLGSKSKCALAQVH